MAVHKRRVRYVINGCTSEVTDVTADGIQSRTIAIESTDGQAVIEAVRSAGLGEWGALAQEISERGGEPMRFPWTSA